MALSESHRARMRNRIETVSYHLAEQSAVARTIVRDQWHFQLRLIRKVLARAIGVFINLRLNRYPIDLGGPLALQKRCTLGSK